MINAILKGIFSLIISLVNVLLTPIDALIESALPDLSNLLSYVSGFFNYAASVVPWGISWLGLPSILISGYVAYMTFKLTLPLAISTIKLAIKWYDKLKP